MPADTSGTLAHGPDGHPLSLIPGIRHFGCFRPRRYCRPVQTRAGGGSPLLFLVASASRFGSPPHPVLNDLNPPPPEPVAAGSTELGRVYLIGAGPGDPELLTIRAAKLLAACDVVLYDGLSNPRILQHAAGAVHRNVGKHGESRIWAQDEIIAEMLHWVRQGKTVARLKGGDPAVFARTAEEVDACRGAGVSFEIVPGITAALAAGSYAGIPVTHREKASAVALVTGHEQPGKNESAIDWNSLASFSGTIVVYMGVTTAGKWTRALMDAGKDPATPTAIVRRCSHPDQQQIHCRLDEVAGHLTPASKFRPPVITIIGDVTELADTMHWQADRPLFGKTILSTRPLDAGQLDDSRDPLTDRLRDAGATVMHQPLVRLSPPPDDGSITRLLDDLHQIDWLMFSSGHGVRYFMHAFHAAAKDVRSLAGVQIACVGRKTADVLAGHGLHADLVPRTHSARGLLGELPESIAETRAGIVRATRGSDRLASGLRQIGASVCEAVAYTHADVDDPETTIAEALRQGTIDWITVTSSATAENLRRLFGDDIGSARVAALSPVTASTLKRLGIDTDVVSSRADMMVMAEEIIDYEIQHPLSKPRDET